MGAGAREAADLAVLVCGRKYVDQQVYRALRSDAYKSILKKIGQLDPDSMSFTKAEVADGLTDEEKKKVEDIVNEKIAAALPVVRVELPKAEAEKTGALHFFGDKYGDKVKVYTIGDPANPFSREVCGGPHVEHTGQIGESGKHFKIVKEEAGN